MHKYFCSAAGYKRNFGGYMIFRPRLTKYCQGCVPGVPGGVDAPVVTVGDRSFASVSATPGSATVSPMTSRQSVVAGTEN